MANRDGILRMEFDGAFVKKVAHVGVWLLAAVLCYALSFGPALRLSGAKGSARKGGLPKWISIAYYPLLKSNLGPLENVYDQYLKLWIPLD